MLHNEKIVKLTQQCRKDVSELHKTACIYSRRFESLKKTVYYIQQAINELEDYNPEQVAEFKASYFYQQIELVFDTITDENGYTKIVDDWLKTTSINLNLPSTDHYNPPKLYGDTSITTPQYKIDKFLRDQRKVVRDEVKNSISFFPEDRKVSNKMIVRSIDIKGRVDSRMCKDKKRAMEEVEKLKRYDYVEIRVGLVEYLDYKSSDNPDDNTIVAWDCNNETLKSLVSLYNL